MKKGWEIKRLPDIAEYFIGLTYAPKDVSNVGTIVLRSSNIQNDELDLSDLVRVTRSVKEILNVRKGDILMCSRNGSKRLVGKTAVIGNLPEEMTFGTFMTVIRGKHNPYLAWFFKSDAFRDQIGVGENTMINQITKYMLDAIRVPFPPPAEQQRTVGLLDEAFEGLATAKANAEKNLQNARALFESHLQSVFTQRGLGWVEKPLGELCDILDNQRKPITKRDRVAGDIPYYGATCIQDYVKDFIFDEPLVLVGEDGAKWNSGDKTAFAVSGKCWVNNHAHVLRPHRDKVTDYWLISFLTHSDLTPFVSGLTVPKLNQGNLREIPIPLPPISIQRQLATTAESLEEETQRLARLYERKLAALEALKKSLLHQAFSGAL